MAADEKTAEFMHAEAVRLLRDRGSDPAELMALAVGGSDGSLAANLRDRLIRECYTRRCRAVRTETGSLPRTGGPIL